MIQSSAFDRTVKEFNHLFIKVIHNLEEEKEVGILEIFQRWSMLL